MNSILGKYSKLIIFIIGFGLFTFTRTTTFVPITVIVAPIFILYLSRTNKILSGSFITVIGMVLAMQLSLTNLSGIIDFDIMMLLDIVKHSLLGILLALAYIFDRLLVSKFNGFISTLVFPISAVSVYFITSKFGLVFLFNLFKGTGIFYGYTQYGNLVLVQFMSLFGVWGLVFLFSWISSTILWAYENSFKLEKIKKGVLILTVVYTLVLIYGGIRTSGIFFDYSGKTTRVAAVTFKKVANENTISLIDNMNDRKFTPLNKTLDKIKNKLEIAKSAGAQFTVFQEFSLIIPEEQEIELKNRLKEMSKKYNMYICIGYVTLPKLLEGEHKKDFMGNTILSDEYEEGYNKALLIDSEGNEKIEYLKRNLATGEGAFILEGPGKISVVDTPYGRVGVVICKDMSMSDYMREAGKKNADIVFAPSYEAAKSLSITYTQMLRTVENGFSFVRPVYNGLSVAVDYDGRILSSMNHFTANNEIMYADVPVQGKRTLYTIIGDSFAYICLIVFILMIFTRIFMSKKKFDNILK